MCVMCIMIFTFRKRNIKKEERWNYFEEKWENPILETLAGSISEEKMLKLVEQGEELYWIDFLVKYAKRLKGSELIIIRSLASPYLDIIKKRADILSDPEYQARALRTLSQLGDEKYLDMLLDGLKSNSPLVVMIASRELALKGHPEHGKEIVNSLENYIHWDHHFLSAMISNMGTSFLETLREKFLSQETSIELKTVIARSLIKLGDQNASASALELLKSETDLRLINSAIYIVENLGTVDDLEIIRPFIEHEQPSVRISALRAISGLSLSDETDLYKMMFSDTEAAVVLALIEILVNNKNSEILKCFASGKTTKSMLAKEALRGMAI